MAKKRSHKLGEFFATSIAGNDILSSALYVSGIAALFAGVYAPIVLAAVGFVLFFYRTVYREVVSALPVNGGAYNALLNGTSKTFAAIAGVMTVLSYVATAVISAKTAVAYLFFLLSKLGFDLSVWITLSVLGILFLFALLVINGVKDSARVAAGIFIFHLATLTGLCLFSLVMVMLNANSFWSANIQETGALIASHGGLLKTLFLGFSASLLGVSGFESSANFVEEQAPGVFPKTLRNMTLGVLIFNPLLAFVTLNVLPLNTIFAAKDFVLAQSALHVGGIALLAIVGVDAFLVLCGAVLTSFIGVSGLVHRMALDGCLPAALIKENKKKAHPRIIISFGLLCASILLLTKGDLLSLAGVYTISFLSVMTFFAASNLILRANRPDLKRPYKAPIMFVIIALISTLVGLMGNISIDPRYTGFFLTYFIPAVGVVFIVIYRKNLYQKLASIFRWWPDVTRFFKKKYTKAAADHLFVFVHHINRLYGILEYIHQNESGHIITLIHCKHKDANKGSKLTEIIETLRMAGMFPHFKINVEYLDMPFGPDAVNEISKKHHVSQNKIFIGSIHHEHAFNYEDLGGARVIL